MRMTWIIVTTLAAVGCANPVSQHNAAKYHEWGSQAEFAGDYRLAEQNFERALINAQTGGSPDSGISMVMYNLGRMKGYLCKYDEAEKLLVAALEMEERVSGPDSGVTAMRLFELARLHFARKQYAQSADYYARAIPVVQKLGVEQSDPIALAEAVSEYAEALEAAGRTGASDARQLAERLRQANPGVQAKFVPVSYAAQPCAQ